MIMSDLLNEFLLSRRLADLSDKTILDYTLFITPFIDDIGKNKPIKDVMQSDINNYIAKLLNRPLSKATRSTYIRHIKVFLKWCSENYCVSYEYKRVKVPKNPKKNVKIYSEDELKAIFDSITAESEWMTARNKCIIALMYDSGLRQSEVCGLERAKVSFSTNRIVVCGKGNKERTVPLGKLTAHFMQLYYDLCPFTSDKVFVGRHGQPLTCNAVKLLVTKISNSLPFDVSSHKLRHNFATNFCLDQYEKYGRVDIYQLMILLGHEDIETTKRYLHLANEIIGAKNCISHLDLVLCGEN